MNDGAESVGFKVFCWTCRAKTPHERLADGRFVCRGCNRAREISPEVQQHAAAVTLKPVPPAQLRRVKRPKGYKLQ